MTRHPRVPARRLRLVLVTAVAALAGCGPTVDVHEESAPPVISVDPGLHPTLAAEDVARLVLGQIRSNEVAVGRTVAAARIVRMTVTTWAGAARIEPNAGRPDPPSNETVWVVRAFGTFTNRRTPPGARPAIAGSGFFIIGDADGAILSDGFP